MRSCCCTQKLSDPGCPVLSCLWLHALNAYGEGVWLIFPQPSEKEPDTFVCSQDTEVKQITKMPDWDLSLISDPNNSKINPYIWNKESDLIGFTQCPTHSYFSIKKCIWMSTIVKRYCSKLSHFKLSFKNYIKWREWKFKRIYQVDISFPPHTHTLHHYLNFSLSL